MSQRSNIAANGCAPLGCVRGGDQAESAAFLANPATYAPAVVDRVERIETHGALIFLAGDRAFKLKRAVKLPYLDFSTLAKRERACRHELERNKPFAPDIYITVEAIVRADDGRLTIGGDGDPVDWVVVMKRFDQDCLFDALARNGRLSVDLMPRLADAIAAYHDQAQIFRGRDGHQELAGIVAQVVLSLFEAGQPLEHDRVHAFADRIVAELNCNAQLLRMRAHRGFMRLCHGDLHLRNIVLVDGKPVLFDAIEFDDRIARIDVLYDLAFLLMDLWRRDLRSEANQCFNAYASATMSADALDGLAALPLFLATRAAIRAMVGIDRAELATAAATRADSDAEIGTYFDLAGSFLGPCKPAVVAVGGLSGTGKTTLAAALAPQLGRAPGALHLRSDVERKRMVGIAPAERLPQHAYSASATAKVYKRLCDRAERALAAGHSVIADATFLEATHRRQIEHVARTARVPFVGLWLEAGRETLIERVTARRNDASDADATIVEAQFAAHRHVTCWATVDAGGTFETALAQASFAVEVETLRRR